MSVLILGFGITFALTIVTIVAIVVELDMAQRRTMELADEGQRTTYGLADIGKQLARLRAQLASGLYESPGEFGRRAERLARIDTVLRGEIDRLDSGGEFGHLETASRGAWTALSPDIRRLRQTLTETVAFIRTTQVALARDLFARAAPLSSDVQDRLDEILGRHRQAMLGALRAARRQVTFAHRVAMSAGAVFLFAMLGIWSIVYLKLSRQDRYLVQANARLESANADLDAFAGRVAHDLINALGPVALSPPSLRRAAADSGRVLEIAQRIERCSRRAIAMVDALLAFSRASRQIEGGEIGIVRSVVDDVVEELAPLAAKLEVLVVVKEMGDVRVRCNPGLLHIVLANLCGNAIKYLDGQPSKRVSVSVAVDGAWCRIEVEDTGPGIPREAQERIFEPFYRVEGTRAPGTGIGLATVRRIVDARGGRIAVESAEGKGARFVVWLPIAPAAADATGGERSR